MTKQIFKYPVPMNSNKFSLMLPVVNKLVRVAFQNDKLFAWYEVDKDSVKKEFKFQTFGTGQDIPQGAIYLSTYDYGPFVLHIYLI